MKVNILNVNLNIGYPFKIINGPIVKFCSHRTLSVNEFTNNVG